MTARPARITFAKAGQSSRDVRKAEDARLFNSRRTFFSSFERTALKTAALGAEAERSLGAAQWAAFAKPRSPQCRP